MNSVGLKPIEKGISEKDVEKYLCGEIRKLGGVAYKFSSPARRHVPDRLCVMPHGITVFIECKAPGKKPTKAQNKEMKNLHDKGHRVLYVDTYKSVDSAMMGIQVLINVSDIKKNRVN